MTVRRIGPALSAQALLLQAGYVGIRIAVVYRAIELDAEPMFLGTLAASFAAPAIVFGIPLGQLAGRRGGALVAWYGMLLMLGGAVGAIVVPGLAALLAFSMAPSRRADPHDRPRRAPGHDRQDPLPGAGALGVSTTSASERVTTAPDDSRTAPSGQYSGTCDPRSRGRAVREDLAGAVPLMKKRSPKEEFMSDVTGAAPKRDLLASFPDYAGAQTAVDRLSDSGFPVAHVSIVGWNVRIEEQVTGRVTNWRAAGYGALSGAWFGLFVGLLFGLLAPGDVWLWLLLWGLVLGAVWGAVFGFVGHAVLGGRRDFSSVQKLVAEHWDVMVDSDLLLRAQGVLATPVAGSGTA